LAIVDVVASCVVDPTYLQVATGQRKLATNWPTIVVVVVAIDVVAIVVVAFAAA